MNKHILMVMDKESFTKGELKKNKESAYDAYDADNAYADYAAAYAAYATYDDYDYDDYDDYWIDAYFKETGESKQDYIDEIKRVKESVKEKALDYTQDMADNGELPSVGMECRFDTNFFTIATSNRGTCEIIAYYGGKVWINIIDFDCVINISVIEFKPLIPPLELTDKEKAIDDMYKSLNKDDSRQGGCDDLFDDIKAGKIHGVSFQPLKVESSLMQTLAQAYKFCGGKVPHRHNDVLIENLESNIIAFVTPCIKNLFYLTFPKDRIIPDGFKYFCTVEEFIDFVPPMTLIDGKAYQFDYRNIETCGVYSKDHNLLYSADSIIDISDCTNIQPLTVEVK